MLSATIPNYEDFAKWVGRIKNTTIYMQITNKRVVPLEHKIYLGDNEKQIFVCKNEKDEVKRDEIKNSLKELDKLNEKNFIKQGSFKPQHGGQGGNYNQIKKNFNNNYGGGTSFNSGSNNNRGKATSNKIIEMAKYLITKNLTPGVIFVFSIKKIDEYARDLGEFSSNEAWISRDETSKIIKFFDKCIGILNSSDQNIPQIKTIKELLKRGIGVHHAGLLPILKETVEILYSKGLIKILFATTSFSIGLNMPTRTVVFTEISKYNDQQKEILSSSEYLQMCGRAGRRGIDDKGHVFILLGDKSNPPKEQDIATMMKDGGTQVESRFRLSYKTIIQILSRDIKDINQFFKESFLENSKMSLVPEEFKKQSQLRDKLSSFNSFSCILMEEGNESNISHIRNYYGNIESYKSKKSEIWKTQVMRELLSEGRVVRVNSLNLNTTVFGVILRYYYPPTYSEEYRVFFSILKSDAPKPVIEYEDDENYVSKVDLKDKWGYYIQVAPVHIEDIIDFKLKVSKEMLKNDSNDFTFMRDHKTEDSYAKELIDLSNNPDRKVKPVDYDKIIKSDIKTYSIYHEKNKSLNQIVQSPCENCKFKDEHMAYINEYLPIEKEYQKVQDNLNEENMKYSEEFKKRINVLKSLKYIDDDSQILVKGKAARELSTTDCVIMTETLLGGVLDGLTIKEKIAFMSGWSMNKNEIELEDPQISTNFTAAVKKYKLKIDQLTEIEKKGGFEENKYNRRSTFSLSKSILGWMNGMNFIDILKASQLEEGKLFALLMRLYQLCDELKNFFSVLNLEENSKSFEEAKQLIIRDIMSCKSLYLQEIDFDI